MGLIPSYCRTLISLHKMVGLKGPLLTLGNQDVWANYDQLKSFFDEMECPWVEPTVFPHTSRLFKRQLEEKGFVHARTFFEMMGINEYYDIDKFENDSPQILHDLNAPVPSGLQDRFHLIIDGGTIEHIFDVRQVMENIVNMCRETGQVVHFTPSSNYVDHGFYSFSPCFFYDFYAANGFADFICYILQAEPENFYAPCSYFRYSYGMNLSGLIDPSRVAVVFFAANKVRSSGSLALPTQGAFQSEFKLPQEQVPSVKSASIDQGTLDNSLIERWFPSFLIHFTKPIRPLLGALRRRVRPPYKRLRTI